MICNKCKTKIDLVGQIKEADENWWENVTAPIILTIFCGTCEEPPYVLNIEPAGDFEEIDTPVGKVKVPTKAIGVNMDNLVE